MDSYASWTATEKSTVFTYNWNNGVRDAKTDFKTGYMQTSTDETGKTTSTIAGVQHTFGLLGQLDSYAIATKKAFRWKKPASEDIHYMMVSIFPYDQDATDMTGAETIELDVYRVDFGDTEYTGGDFTLTAPTKDITAIPVKLGANTLIGSAVAFAGVMLTLA